MRTAFMIILGIISILLIVVVMLQSNNGEGLSSSVIGGGAADSLFGNKKSKGYEKTLNKLTIILGVVFVAITIVLLVIK